MVGEITNIIPSKKSMRPLILDTLPGKNSAKCVYAIIFFKGTELPKMKIVI